MEKSKTSSVCCYVITLLLAAGVIVTLLTVLLVDLSPPEPTEAPTTPPTEPPPPTETPVPETGDFTYAEIPDLGKFQALKSSQGPTIFAGVPYAQPPTGEFRWANPREALPLQTDGGYYDATSAKPACPQLCTLPSPDYVCPKEMDEDCLHVVVYVPGRLTERVETAEGYYYRLRSDIASAGLPVMVFFHGGAFITGGNGVILYDGRFIAEKGDVIVVTVNYRLGPFGFFYQDSGTPEAALGNYAINDQVESLKWVQKHIRNFGGNPGSVTLFGQSAGAQSVAVHLVNDESDPLFHRAILQSNPFGLSFKNVTEAQTLGERFVNFMKEQGEACESNDMRCLREIPAQNIVNYLKDFPISAQFNPESFSQLFEPWSPVIDQKLLNEHPFFLFKQGLFQNKPMVHGFTTDEGIYFIAQALAEPSTSTRLYKLFIRALFGDSADLVEAQYPYECSPFSDDCDDIRLSIDDWVTDQLFTCPTRRVLNVDEKFGDPNLQVWWYTFDQLWSFPEFWQNYTVCYNLTCHAAELPYLFDVDTLTDFRFTPEEQELAQTLIYYWTNFAKSGDPNKPSQMSGRFSPRLNDLLESKKRTKAVSPVYWPRIYEGFGEPNMGSGSIEYQTLKLTSSANGGEVVVDNFQKEICDFWDQNDFYLEDSLKLGILPRRQKEEFLRQIRVRP